MRRWALSREHVFVVTGFFIFTAPPMHHPLFCVLELVSRTMMLPWLSYPCPSHPSRSFIPYHPHLFMHTYTTKKNRMNNVLCSKREGEIHERQPIQTTILLTADTREWSRFAMVRSLLLFSSWTSLRSPMPPFAPSLFCSSPRLFMPCPSARGTLL